MQQPAATPPGRFAPVHAPHALWQRPVQPVQPSPVPPPAPQWPPNMPTLSPGTVLDGRYVVEGYIGGGGFAHIYRAQDRTFQQRRAIKEAFYFDDATRQQFNLEAEFLRNAHHPHLVRGYASFEQGGRLYLVMEYVDGQTVEDIAIEHIRRTHRALGEAQVLDWMIPICDAVQALHTQPVPIIHRDVKPANIKLDREKRIPILIDLGLAKLYARGNPTIAAALAFTPGYAPPEQYHAAGQTDQRTDVYGLGATLFFLLTGYQPTESPARLTTQSLPALRSLNPLLSLQTEMIVQRAMALNPDQRYQSAAALMTELQGARAALGQVAGNLAPVRALGTATSGGRVAEHSTYSCSQCGASNPDGARYCKTCGSEITLELPAGALPIAHVGANDRPLLAAVPAERNQRAASQDGDRSASSAMPPADAPRLSRVVAPPQAAPQAAPRLTPAIAAARGRAIPTPPRAVAIVRGQDAARRADSTNGTGPSAVEIEAAASVLALLALVCVSLSLIGAFLPPMLLFAVVGIALAHWVLGVPWHAQLAASPLGPRIQQRPALARMVVPGMPMPQEFRLVALVALVVGYLWLVISIAQLIWSLHMGR